MPERKRGSGSAGRFGPRYGRVARRRVSEIEGAMRDAHTCPECGETRVARAGTGLWECSGCGHKFTGGAYRPETPGGRTVRRSIRAALSEGAESALEVSAPDLAADEAEDAAEAAEVQGDGGVDAGADE